MNIPNAFFLTDPTRHPGFHEDLPTAQRTFRCISRNLSAYSVVGGSGNFPAPAELGLATVNASAVPEPAGLTYMALSGFGLLAGRVAALA